MPDAELATQRPLDNLKLMSDEKLCLYPLFEYSNFEKVDPRV